MAINGGSKESEGGWGFKKITANLRRGIEGRGVTALD
jgi:hypothetical protein